LAQIDTLLPGWGLLDLITDPPEDVAGSVSLADHALERLIDLLQIRRLRGEEAHCGMGVIANRTDRLIDFMRDRGGKLSHCRQAARVRQLHLQGAECFGRALALSQVEHEGNTLGYIVLEACQPDQHRDAAAILPEELLFERLQAACDSQLRYPHMLIA